MRRLSFHEIERLLALVANYGHAGFDLGGVGLFFLKSRSVTTDSDYMDVYLGSGPFYSIFQEADTNRFELPLVKDTMGRNAELARKVEKWVKPWLKRLWAEYEKLTKLGFSAEIPCVQYFLPFHGGKLYLTHQAVRSIGHDFDGVGFLLKGKTGNVIGRYEWVFSPDMLAAFKNGFFQDFESKDFLKDEFFSSLSEGLRMELVENG